MVSRSLLGRLKDSLSIGMAIKAFPSTLQCSPERASPDPRRGGHTPNPRTCSRSPAPALNTRRRQSTPHPPSRRASVVPQTATPVRTPPDHSLVRPGPRTPMPRSPDKRGILGWADDILPTSPAPPSTAQAPSEGNHRVRTKEKFVIDGIERESWEVITQDAMADDDHARVSEPHHPRQVVRCT